MIKLPIKLPSDYILVIAEKPRAAEKIAKALGTSNKINKIKINGVPVWMVYRGYDYYLITSTVGHMYTMYTKSKGYPVYDYKWVPRYFVDSKARHVKKFLEVLAILFKSARVYINACDYDIEGSLIGYMVIKNLGDEKKALRAKFSSLTPFDILAAFENLTSLDYDMIEAGFCRHVLDWLWGINSSRALMDLYSRSFKTKKILSAGRVQTPTLAYITDIILQRNLHAPTPLAYPVVQILIGDMVYTLESLDPPYDSIDEAYEYISRVKNDPYAYVENIVVKLIEIPPPHPFNLPDLQNEAYRILKISPYRAQKLAEDLYLETLISYPRTNSQKLPPTLNNKTILKKLSSLNKSYELLVNKLFIECNDVFKPNNGSKDDPAHPAIYPTGEGSLKNLTELHFKLYDLIVRRYLATFAKPMKSQYVNIYFIIQKRRYLLRGVKIIEKGWSFYYPFIETEDRNIPYNLLSSGMLVPIKNIRIVVRHTPQPKLPTKIEILKWMEKVEIGTESTRAEIIETLFKRGYTYTMSRGLEVSDLAIALIHIIKKYIKELVSVDLTRDFEKMLNDIKSGRISCKAVEEKAKLVIDSYLKKLKLQINDIVDTIKMYVENEENSNDSKNNCRLCRRYVYKDNLCIFHYEALSRIKDKYKNWQKFNYNWRNYLEKLCKLKSSGKYIKEVSCYLLKFDLDLQ